MKRATQKEVAERAGVSRATVSYVINGTSSEAVPISPGTRQKVLAAVEELGYQPNNQARTLRSGKTMIIGVLLLDMHNPHFWQYLTGIEEEAHLHGYTIMLFHTALKRTEEDVALRELTQKRIDGAIVNSSYPFGTHDKDTEKALRKMPIVVLSAQQSPFDYVRVDYREATQELMDYLYGLGHRRFGFVFGVANPENGLDRLEPYRAFLKEKGISSGDDGIIECGPKQEDGFEAACRLFAREDRPTAVIAINDYLAVGVLRAAADAGLSVPGDVSVCGYDDIPFSQYLVPRLTTVCRDIERAGRQAFRLLLDRMNGATGPARIEMISNSLQIRESTGPVPGP